MVFLVVLQTTWQLWHQVRCSSNSDFNVESSDPSRKSFSSERNLEHFTFYLSPSLFFLVFLKCLLNRSRNCNRARNNLDFTAGTLRPSASAVSSVLKPSTSRRTKTVRKPEGSPWMVFSRISLNSACLYCCSGLGLQSVTSRGTKPSSVSTSSSMETVLLALRLRSFISASFTAMRTSQV